MIHFPVAALIGLIGADLAFLVTDNFFWARLSLWLAGIGALGGWVSGAIGMLDLVISAQIRSLITAWCHGMLAVMMLSLATLNWLLRVGQGVADNEQGHQCQLGYQPWIDRVVEDEHQRAGDDRNQRSRRRNVGKYFAGYGVVGGRRFFYIFITGGTAGDQGWQIQQCGGPEQNRNDVQQQEPEHPVGNLLVGSLFRPLTGC